MAHPQSATPCHYGNYRALSLTAESAGVLPPWEGLRGMKGKESDDSARQGCGVASQCAGGSPRGCLSTSSSEGRHCPGAPGRAGAHLSFRASTSSRRLPQLLPHRSIPFESLWFSHANVCTEPSCFTRTSFIFSLSHLSFLPVK